MKETLNHADRLAEATSEADYQERLIAMLRENSAVDLSRIELPRTPGIRGLIGFWWQNLLWRLLRCQQAQVTLEHNAIHTLHAATLEFEHEYMRQRIDQLEQRVAQCEQQKKPRTQADKP